MTGKGKGVIMVAGDKGVAMSVQEANLVEGIRRGDRASMEKAYDTYFNPLANFVYYTVYDYDRSLDICQDAFLKVVEAIKDKGADVREFKPYLFAAARNLAFDELRRSGRLSDYPVESIAREDPNIFADPARAALLSEQRAQVAAAASRLNENQRTALALKDIEGWSYDDIGSLLGMNRNAVGALLSRARLKFRREFRLQQIDEAGLPEACRDFLPVMSAVMDGEASQAEKDALQQHMASCPDCRELMNEMAGASTTLRSLVPLAPVVAIKAALLGKALASAGVGAGAAAAGAAAAGVGISALGKAVIGGVVALLVAGAGVGTYFGVKNATSTPTPPAASITRPADGETVTLKADASGNVAVQISAAVSNSPSGVELEIDGRDVTGLEGPGYTYDWTTSTAGEHSVRAVALDGEGKEHPGAYVTFNLVIEGGKDMLVYVREGDVFSSNTDGTGEKRLSSVGNVERVATSPSGKRIAFETLDGIIFRMDSSGGDFAQVTLPEKGVARFPVFDPEEKYIYFTRITPEEMANSEAGRDYSVRFERYDIASNSVSTTYVKPGVDANGTVFGLFCGAPGNELFFNLYGSDWPSSEVRKLVLGGTVTEEAVLPKVVDNPDYWAICYRLTDVSPDGKYLAYFEEKSSKTTGPEGAQNISISCIREASGGAPVVLETNDHFGTWQDDIDSIKFSRADATRYLCSKQLQQAGAPIMYFNFYTGIIGDTSMTQIPFATSNLRDWEVIRAVQ